MNKQLFFLTMLVLLGAISSADAQSLNDFKEHLGREIVSENAPEGARITIREEGDAAQVVAASAAATAPLRLRGYRVCIFFDNGQNARAEAMEARKLFEEHFAGIPLYMVYENPYFRVTVGNCLTIEEAIILKGKVAGHFPKAFPKSEELTLKDLLK